MIIPFLLIALGLLALIVLLFRKSLWGSIRREQGDEEQAHLLLYRSRVGELQGDVETSSVLEAVRDESERDLLKELEQLSPEPSSPSVKSGWGILTLSLLLVPVATALLYFHFGRPDLLERPPLSVRQDADQAIHHLAEQLESQPNNPDGWILLGRSLSVMQRPLEAARAYEFALKFKPEDPEIRLAYAEALAESRGGNLAGQPIEMVREVLKHHPNQRFALWLSGLEAAQSERYKDALRYWRQLRQEMGGPSPETQELDSYIAELDAKLTPGGSTEKDIKIRVRVSLAKAFKGKKRPDTRVFIFAKASNGPPMPLAVVQKTVADLPLEVELNDQMAMVPGRNLSSAKEITLGARISESGTPTQSSGDIQGFKGPIQIKNGSRYEIVISQEVP